MMSEVRIDKIELQTKWTKLYMSEVHAFLFQDKQNLLMYYRYIYLNINHIIILIWTSVLYARKYLKSCMFEFKSYEMSDTN